MPTEITIEIFLDWIDKPVGDEFGALSDSAEALLHFLRHLDQVKPEIPQYYAIGRPSRLRPRDYPVKQKITIYSRDQLLAIADILSAWVNWILARRFKYPHAIERSP